MVRPPAAPLHDRVFAHGTHLRWACARASGVAAATNERSLATGYSPWEQPRAAAKIIGEGYPPRSGPEPPPKSKAVKTEKVVEAPNQFAGNLWGPGNGL